MLRLIDSLIKAIRRISWGVWLYDRIANNLDKLAAFAIAGGGMGILTALTESLAPLGPAGIGGAVLIFGILAWNGLAIAQSWRAKTRLRRAELDQLENWPLRVDAINPLIQEFNKQRIQISDLVHPVTRKIVGKRFIDCELMGPANLFFSEQCMLNKIGLFECDVVPLRPDAVGVQILNVVQFADTEFLEGSIWNCTLFIRPNNVETFRQMGAGFITLTGDPDIDAEQKQLWDSRVEALKKAGNL